MSNNMVLVNKTDNIRKTNAYPIEERVRCNQQVRALWDMLHKNKLINDEKYHRLTRASGFTEEEQAGFIQRQLVETSQGTKGVADLLKELYDPSVTRIVYAKARNVSEFRHQYDLPKCRLVNDFHHANDVVGNAYYVKFTQDPRNFIRNEYMKDSEKNRYNLNKMFDWDIRRGSETAWVASGKDNPGTIAVVKKMLGKNTPLLTRFSYEGHGGLANATLYAANKVKDKGYIPFKINDPKMSGLSGMKKYGGFSSVSTAYFFLVEHDKGNKRIRTIETVPIYLAPMLEDHPDKLDEYCINQLGHINHSVRMRKIKLHSLVRRNGYYSHITGVTGNQIYSRNAMNLCLNAKWIRYIKKIEKYYDSSVMDDLISVDQNIELYDVLLEKHKNSCFRNRPNPMGDLIEEKRNVFIALSCEDQVTVLYQLLNLTAIGLPSADLKLIGAASASGTTKFGKDITKAEEFLLINQSVTGLIESRPIDLLTI